MLDSIVATLEGEQRYAIVQGDSLDVLRGMPKASVDLILTSPPYERARSYGEVKFSFTGQDWVDWLIPRVVEMCRVSAGPVFLNAAGQVKRGVYSPVMEWLVADLTRHHDIVCCTPPYVYFRFGVPGSGGDHRHRRDWEPVYGFSSRGKALIPWSDNTVMGHPPRWAPGGAMSHRLASGDRVNQWGGSDASGNTRRVSGDRQPSGRPSHRKKVREPNLGGKVIEQDYTPPDLANPGNVIREHYDAEEIRQILAGGELGGRVALGSAGGDVIRCLVGGGQTGDRLAHENEAPFSEYLAEFFVRSFCPPGGVVLDPFVGSGTTGKAAIDHGRRFIGIDVRESQARLSEDRLSRVTPPLPGMEG